MPLCPCYITRMSPNLRSRHVRNSPASQVKVTLKLYPPKLAQWHCWSGLSHSRMPASGTICALFEELPQPSGPRWRCWSRWCSLQRRFVSLYLFPTKRAQWHCWLEILRQIVIATKWAKWHCWSGLASSLPSCFAESERLLNATLLGPPTKRAKKRCWSGFPTKRAQEALLVGRWFSEYLDEILSKVLPPLSVLAVSQTIGPKWLCWSGLGHAL